MTTTQTYYAIYRDSLGVPRVWGIASTKDKAIQLASLQLDDYQLARPDMRGEFFTLECEELT